MIQETKFLDKVLERIERIDRYQLEDYLKKLIGENAFLKNAINGLEQGVIILDKDLRVKMINTQAEYLLGISDARIRDRKITQCPLDSALLEYFGKTISPGKTLKRIELNVSFPQEQLLSIFTAPIEAIEEEPEGWLITVQDRRESSQKFQTEKFKALIGMATILAHELGNPLNSLSIHLDLINRTLKKLPKKYDGKISKLLEIARQEVKRLDSIVTRFLQAARPLKPRFFEGDINRILEETLEFLKPELKKSGITVEKKIDRSVPKIYLDNVQIRQAFVNIIKNAIESIGKNGRIDIKTKLERNRINISFSDNGCGIFEKELERIFEPYYSTKQEGSGLGLMIVNRIVRDHGGQIDVKSKEGKGTTVTIYLPVEQLGTKLLAEK